MSGIIDLNHQSRMKGTEIDDPGSKWNLTSEPGSALTILQDLPDPRLGHGHFQPKTAGALARQWSVSWSGHHVHYFACTEPKQDLRFPPPRLRRYSPLRGEKPAGRLPPPARAACVGGGAADGDGGGLGPSERSDLGEGAAQHVVEEGGLGQKCVMTFGRRDLGPLHGHPRRP